MTDNEAREARDIRQAIEIYIGARVDRTPAVAEAWNEFHTSLKDAQQAMEEHGMTAPWSDSDRRSLARVLSMDLGDAAGAVMAETLRAAFYEGLTFDGRALLLDGQDADRG